MKLIERATMFVQSVAVAIVLTGCVASDTSLETAADFVPEPVLDPEILAAIEAPCAAQKDFQVELNGAPDDSLIEKDTAFGKTVTEERYWYADSSMIVYFTHAEGETWCNVWNEGGVLWDN